MSPDAEFAAYRDAARRAPIVPIVREFSADTLTPVVAYAAIRRPPFAFLLESLVGGERWARYTFLGTEPERVWRYQAGTVRCWRPAEGWESAVPAPDPLAHLQHELRPLRAAALPGLPRFTGGAVGFLGYDAVRALEHLPEPPPDDVGFPDAVFMLAGTVLIFDNAFGRAIVVANTRPPPAADDAALRRHYEEARAQIDALLERLGNPPRLAPLPPTGGTPRPPVSPYPRERFEADVRRVQEHIRAGDVFQAVLSRRQEVPCAAAPLQVYRALRALNPAPYLYLLELDDLAVAGSSPEVLVRVEAGEVTVRPIAGTRPRGGTPAEDAALAAALLADPKELAEHAMLVDLGRNDVGRVAAFGTVRLTADRAIERYSHVQHIVSEVRGRLAPGRDGFDALRACFPAGTVSGAPKIRAMEILDALEPTRRGPYAGAVGYVGWGGATLDTAIAIRTAVLHDRRAFVQAGAGIVADSDAAREFEETESKAQAVLAALARAAG